MGNITSRDIETLNSQSGTIATRSTRAKPSGPAPVHGGMHHVGDDADGTFNAGISRTAAAAALTGGKLPTDAPVIGKVLSKPAIAWGSESQSDVHRQLGAAIMREALTTAPNDHPAKLAGK
jgi:CBS domain-containing protein